MRSHDPHLCLAFALACLLNSSLVLAHTNYSSSAAALDQEACAAPALRQMNYRIETTSPPNEYRTSALALGDFDRNGHADFLAGNATSTARFLNSGNGNFQVLSNLDSALQDAAIADFDNDGYVDVARLHNDVIIVQLGYNPTWAAHPVLTATVVGRFATALRAGDFNRDGRFDLAVVNTFGNSIAVLLGNGDGNFALPINYEAQQNPRSVAVNDFNGDGWPDIVTANEYSETVTVLLGDGNGGFGAHHFPAGSLPQEVAPWDFNRDGNLDLAVLNRGYNTVAVLQNDGAGNFSLATRWELPFVGGALTTNDFNRDGREDVAVAHHEQGEIVLFLGDGNSGVCATTRLVAEAAACCATTDVASTDLNADGTPDLIFVKGEDVSVWLSGAVPNTPPLITALTAPTVAAGSLNFVTTIATVNDAETPVGNLQVEVVAAPAGITLSSLTNNNGTINAVLNVDCAIGIGEQAIRLKVTDANGDSAEASFSLNVVPNTFPTLGAYADVTLGEGNTTVTPSQLPADNGAIASLTATSARYSGQISIDAQGVVTIANNGVAGKYQVIIAAIDNCYNSSATAFTFTINSTAPPPNCDAIGFNAPLNYEVGATPHAMTTGDVNGDGLPDFAVTNRDTNQVTLLLGTNDGARSFRQAGSFEVGAEPRAVAMHDFNGDGKADLAVTNRGSNTVTTLLGDGAGGFTNVGSYDSGSQPFSVAVADFNQDGRLDLVVVNEGFGNLAILDGNGDGSFAAPRYFSASATPQSALIGDFNKDGKADLVVANYATNEVTVLLGLGDGSFESARSYGAGVGWSPGAIALGDVNNDGNEDLIVGKGGFRYVTVLHGSGTGAFWFYTAFIAGMEPQSLALADFNRDGKLDLAVGNYLSHSITVFPGHGTGAYDTFQGQYIDVGARPLSLLSGDFDGDGKADLAIANSGSSTVSVMVNGCGR
ncbi:MAG TPA: VCBS repeat-containing protein [Blastocatellia bacterium]|nr:VCBS repeat-containing protein [Blastocatellia bacterium]